MSLYLKAHAEGACMFSCNLLFGQNDRDLLRVTVVTLVWNGYQDESEQKADPGEENLNLRPFKSYVWHSTTLPLSYPHLTWPSTPKKKQEQQILVILYIKHSRFDFFWCELPS